MVGGTERLLFPGAPRVLLRINRYMITGSILFVYMAALTKNHKLKGLNNRHGLSQGSEGQKFKINSFAGMVLSEAGRENLVQTSL